MAHQITHSDSRLQISLVNCLRLIKAINIARDFYKVLLKAKGIISQVPDTQIQNDSELHETFKELEKVTTGTEPRKVILALLQVEEDTSDETKALSTLFSDLKNVQCRNEAEYLKSLISAVEDLMSSVCSVDIHLCYFGLNNERYNNLEQLGFFLSKFGSSKAKSLLDLMFEVGIRNYDFTEEEKKEIGNLMPEAIDLVKLCIIRDSLFWKARLKPSVFKQRSAIQFLLDDYDKFPSGDKSLIEVIDKAAISFCIGILERSIKCWSDSVSLYYYDEEEEECDLVVDGASKSRLSNHPWWRTKSQRFYKM